MIKSYDFWVPRSVSICSFKMGFSIWWAILSKSTPYLVLASHTMTEWNNRKIQPLFFCGAFCLVDSLSYYYCFGSLLTKVRAFSVGSLTHLMCYCLNFKRVQWDWYFTIRIYNYILLIFLLKFCVFKLAESVIIMPAFGVQLETHYSR